MNQQEKKDEILDLRKKLEEAELELFSIWRSGNHDIHLTEKACDLGNKLLACERVYRVLYGELP